MFKEINVEIRSRCWILLLSPLFVQPMLWEDVHFVVGDLCPMPCDFLS